MPYILGKGPGADYPSPGFAGGSGGGHGGLGGRAASQVTTGAAYGSITEPSEFGKFGCVLVYRFQYSEGRCSR